MNETRHFGVERFNSCKTLKYSLFNFQLGFFYFAWEEYVGQFQYINTVLYCASYLRPFFSH